MIAINTFLILTVWLLLVYGVAASLFIIGLSRARKALRRDFEKWPSVSIVLPARNEAEVLERTIRLLLAQDYPGPWEIIVVDDRSTDRTPDILNRFAQENPRFRFRTVTEPNPPSPKKYALSKGIEIATGEIICTTDADCIFHSRWLRTMISYFHAPVGVVAGLTRFKTADGREPLWQKVQNIDFMLQGYLAAGSIGLGVPSSCNGSNLAYRRTVYDSAVGFSELSYQISGDDVLFAQKIAQTTGWEMVYATAPESIVDSLPVPTLRELFHQRFRWASKGLAYRRGMKFLLFTLYAFFMLLLAFPIVALFYPSVFPFLTMAFLWKLAWDWFVIWEGNRIFGQRNNFLSFLSFEIAYTIFTPIFGLGGLLLPFRWKGDWYRQARFGSVHKKSPESSSPSTVQKISTDAHDTAPI